MSWSDLIGRVNAAGGLDLSELTAENAQDWFHKQSDDDRRALLARIDREIEFARGRAEAGEVIVVALNIFKGLVA